MQNTKRTIRKIEKALCVVLLLTVAACNGKSKSTITKPLVPPKETLISWFRTNHDFCSYNLFSFYYDDDLEISRWLFIWQNINNMEPLIMTYTAPYIRFLKRTLFQLTR